MPSARRCQPAARSPVTEQESGAGQLDSAELEVVAPGALGIEGVRQRRHDVVRSYVVRLGPAEDLRRRPQLRSARAGWDRRVHLCRESERCGHPAGQVRCELPGSRVGCEDRTVAQIAVGLARELVVPLRQPPDVVVAVERAGLVSRADADLDVDRVVLRVPRLAAASAARSGSPSADVGGVAGPDRRCASSKSVSAYAVVCANLMKSPASNQPPATSTGPRPGGVLPTITSLSGSS